MRRFDRVPGGMRTGFIRNGLAWALVLWLGGCEGPTGPPPVLKDDKIQDPYYEADPDKRSSVFGEGGLSLFGDDKKKNRLIEEGGGGVAVNSFLWRATLDTISFMPVNSADPFGGVVITDWYSSPDSPDERFKVNIYILTRSLRADGVRVAVFRQVIGDQGVWRDAAVPERMNTDVEDAILTKARQMRNEMLLQ